MSAETAVPILPSRDLDRTADFYGRLGFAVGFRQDAPDPYLIVRRGGWELHFFVLPGLDPLASDFMCFLRTPDADRVHTDWSAAGLPAGGVPRLTAPADGDHGVREFALVDPDGTLVRVGHVIRR